MDSMLQRTSTIFLAIIFLFFLPAISSTQTLTGKVIKISDGDTITLLDNQHRQTKIRLYGIDTPEKGQAYGQKAKRFTASLVAGKSVSVKVYDTDRYGRSVGVVYSGRTNVNEEIIRAGYAWQYRKYCKASFCSKWLTLEQEARNSELGLWRDKHPQPPWEWRKAKRNGGSSSSTNNFVNSGTGIYHGNVKSHVFHGPGCRHYNCKNCVKMFGSKDEAVRAGYRPHKQCVE